MKIFVILLCFGIFASAQETEVPPLEIERVFKTVREGGIGDGPFLTPRKLANGMWAQTFVIPPTFLSSSHGASGAVEADPFAPEPSEQPVKAEKDAAKKILENAGITFPKGSMARYFHNSDTLLVILPLDQVELVEAYTASIGSGAERQIFIRVELFELEESHYEQIIESSLNEPDHRPERDALINAARQGHARLIACPMTMARSGNRSKVEEGSSFRDKHGNETQEFVLEADPVLGADNSTIDVNLRFEHQDPKLKAPPQKLNAEFTTQANRYQFLGGWKSETEKRKIAFVYTSIQTSVE